MRSAWPDRPSRRANARGSKCLVALALISAMLCIFVPNPKPAAASTTLFTQVSAGYDHTCALTSAQDAMCWGWNLDGMLGDGTETDSSTPVTVTGGHKWLSVSAGGVYSCGITTSNDAYCWGIDDSGQLGNASYNGSHSDTPVLVDGSLKWSYLVAGTWTTCGITTTNVGYCWGGGTTGQLGNGFAANTGSPAAISGGHSWLTLSTSEHGSCGVTTSNVGYCWGENVLGAVGDGTQTERDSPTAVSGGLSFSTIVSGAYHSCGITTGGAAYCWGYGQYGEIGDGNSSSYQGPNYGPLTPTAVSGGHTWGSIAAGGNTTCATTTGNAAYCWGAGLFGEIGNGSTSDVNVPTAVSGGYAFTQMAVGQEHGGENAVQACGKTTGDAVFCWGHNEYGQVGIGNTTDQSTPQGVLPTTAIVTLTATIDPAFTFTVANQSSTCNGESNFVSGAGTASTVALGNLAAAANVSGGQALSVTGNSGNGFTVYINGTQTSQNLRSTSHNWTDVAGSYASPAALGSGERFGYTYHDTTTSSSVTNPSSANFVALTSTAEPVMGSTASQTGSGCVTFDAQTAITTPPATYHATVVYTAVPTF